MVGERHRRVRRPLLDLGKLRDGGARPVTVWFIRGCYNVRVWMMVYNHMLVPDVGQININHQQTADTAVPGGSRVHAAAHSAVTSQCTLQL